VIERTSGITPEDLVPLPCPIEVEYLMGWFREMSRMRQANGMCVSPLSSELLTWQELSGIKLTPFEQDCIHQLDAVYITHHNKKADT
jgi:hypothetical protein